MDFSKVYIHSQNYHETLHQNIYTYPYAIVNRGNAGLARLQALEHPPLHWFDSPAKSGETIIALSDFKIVRNHIILVKYIAIPFMSSVMDGPIDMQEIMSDREYIWINCPSSST